MSRASSQGTHGLACCLIAGRTGVCSEHTAHRWRPAVPLLIFFLLGHMRLMAVYVSCDELIAVLRNTGSNDEEYTRYCTWTLY